MEKIKNLQKAFKDLGIESILSPVREVTTTDGKTHKGMELELRGVYDGELEPYSFIFTPDGEYVDTWLDCPLVGKKEDKSKKTKKKKK